MRCYLEVEPLGGDEVMMRVEPSRMGLVSLYKRPQRAPSPLPPGEEVMAGRLAYAESIPSC